MQGGSIDATEGRSDRTRQDKTNDARTHLHNSLVTRDFEHLPGAEGTVGKAELHNLRVLRELDIVEDDERSIDSRHSLVL